MENQEKIKKNNVAIDDESFYKYKSILLDAEKTLKHIRQAIERKGVSKGFEVDIPESFDEISDSTFSKIKKIDQAYQKGLISYDIAIEMISILIENDSTRSRFSDYVDSLYVERLRKLYALIEIKYQDLLDAFLSGRMSQDEFLKKMFKIKTLFYNEISLLVKQDEELRGPTR